MTDVYLQGPDMDTIDLHEVVGLWAAYYAADERRFSPDSDMAARRRAQVTTCAEILRHLEDHPQNATGDLRERGFVPLTLADLPRRVGGTAPE